jgi:hypothetical protein
MEDSEQYCPCMKQQKSYYQCNITTKTCIASNYPKDPQYLRLEKICDCPVSTLPTNLAEKIKEAHQLMLHNELEYLKGKVWKA